MSKLFVDEIVHQSSQGSGTITLGASGETISLASGAEVSGFTGQNYPAFFAHLSASQSVSNNTITKAQVDTEIFDAGGYYDNSTNYRYTPLVAGKYFVYAAVAAESQTSVKLLMSQALIYKNGSEYTNPNMTIAENNVTRHIETTITVVDMNGSSDYIELYGRTQVGAGTAEFNHGSKQTFFGAFRLGA